MKAAVLEREKRVTAGKRMSSLVGKAAEEDDEFWNKHETSIDQDDGSFHESDEDEANRIDVFDSDFNDSESEEDENDDNHENEVVREEKRQQQQQRNNKTKTSSTKRRSSSSVGFDPKKFINNENLNAGLTLNFPGRSTVTPNGNQKRTAAALAARKKAAAVVSTTIKDVVGTNTGKNSNNTSNHTVPSRRSTRPKVTVINTIGTKPARATNNNKGKRKSSAVTITQEELLLEAAQVTEPENERWILGRKRDAELLNEWNHLQKNKLLHLKDSHRTVISKFHSRRGCYNTITFPEMDYVPDILVSSKTTNTNPSRKQPRTERKICVITGKIARYTCPKTNYPYHDLPSFKELRRRHQAGEPIQQLTTTTTTTNKHSLEQKQSNHQNDLKSSTKIENQPDNILSLTTGQNVVKTEPTMDNVPTNDVPKPKQENSSNTTTTATTITKENKPGRKRKANKKEPNKTFTKNTAKKIKDNDSKTSHTITSIATNSSLPSIQSLSSPMENHLKSSNVDAFHKTNTTIASNATHVSTVKKEAVIVSESHTKKANKEEVIPPLNTLKIDSIQIDDNNKYVGTYTTPAINEVVMTANVKEEIFLSGNDEKEENSKPETKPAIIEAKRTCTENDTVAVTKTGDNNRHDSDSSETIHGENNSKSEDSKSLQFSSNRNSYNNASTLTSTTDMIATVLSQYAKLQRTDQEKERNKNQ